MTSFHLVDRSPWPYTSAVGALGTTTGMVMMFRGYSNGGIVMGLGIIIIIWTMREWWKDVIRESTYMGEHVMSVRRGLSYGGILFIISEVAFFVSFFWGYYHSSLTPTVEIGSKWPPIGVESMGAWGVPLLNTVILLSSGATATWAHNALVNGNRKEYINGLGLTIILGIVFTGLQGLEYHEASFTIADSVYGSAFYVATGFHGLHVLIGTTFLAVVLYRGIEHQLTRHHHYGYEYAAIYWHFVDVVWLFLYVSIYWWGS
jgi:cytochrome c oxidase subunit 3